jgi:hypothetical protein
MDFCQNNILTNCLDYFPKAVELFCLKRKVLDTWTHYIMDLITFATFRALPSHI